MKCEFDTSKGCVALACYSSQKCNSRDKEGNPKYLDLSTGGTKMEKLKPHYSGELSAEFWREVNNLKEPYQRELSACGVLLQNMENTILRWLENYREK